MVVVGRAAIFPQPSYFFGGEGGNSGPAEKRRRGRTRKGFPSAMEPRIAESVSRASDTPGSPRGTGLVTADIAPQLSFPPALLYPGPILIAYTRHSFVPPSFCFFVFFIIIISFFSPRFKIHISKSHSRVVKQLTLIANWCQARRSTCPPSERPPRR